MRVVLFTQFPENENQPRGGVSTASIALIKSMRDIKTLDLHVISFKDNITKYSKMKFGRATIHWLSKSNWPQFLDVLLGPGRKKILQLIEKLNPDIVNMAEVYGLGIYNKEYPMVLTVHGFDHANIISEERKFAKIRSFLWKFIENHGFLRHEYFISINPYVERELKSKSKAKIFNICNAIDHSYFNIKHTPKLGRLFFAGWISPRKNPLTIIRAVGKLVKEGFHIEARFAGEIIDRKYKSKLDKEIIKYGIEKEIVFLGKISASEIRNELAKSQIFILPSLQENSPMAISEALAIGVPVITSNRCGMPFMINNNLTGYLIEPFDSFTLANKIKYLLINFTIYKRMSIEAKKYAREHFFPETIAKKTYNLYSEIIDLFNRQHTVNASN